MDEGDVVDVLAPGAAAGVLIRLPLGRAGTNGQGLRIRLPFLPWKRDEVLLARQWLAVALLQLGLVVPEVDVRGGAGAEDLQDPLRLRREVRLAAAGLPALHRGRRGVVGQKVRQANPGKPRADVGEQAAA